MFKNRQAGFTLAEVMFVLVIAAILFGIVIVAFQTLSRNGRNQARASDRQLIASTISGFYANNRRYPTSANLGQLIPASTKPNPQPTQTGTNYGYLVDLGNRILKNFKIIMLTNGVKIE